MSAWRPTPAIVASVLLHLGVLVLLVWRPDLWPWALAIIFVNHSLLMAAGLWPRSTLLGDNLVRLPAAAAQRGEVAITIDDGPDPEVTPQVLAILAAHGARATFFCIGERALAHPQLCRDIVSGGHDIENHGQRHRNSSSLFGPRAWSLEIGSNQATLASLTGRQPEFFRAVAGLRNPFLDPVLHRFGLRLATWTRRGYDTRCADAERILGRLTRDLAAGDILLLHDGHSARTPEGKPVIVEVLPRLLGELAVRRLKPVTLRSACKIN
ncbi:polysaccharide deacetylase family protein [Rhodocyclus tenuis]|uniref:polysaccharide deacetylase family protein n=1 Tax=Rhodocyclus tenuis TaxID=1066 RepID=UPI0019053635|nr:polysaccharide deacetylase family protein [Rhodocyclus tenuis]MBK1680596.1 polysaccharide deacetylase family protein [Rhodocyclus tenuis]